MAAYPAGRSASSAYTYDLDSDDERVRPRRPPDLHHAGLGQLRSVHSRTAEKVGTVVALLVFDLHGDVAAAEMVAQTTYAAAIRYDPYGQTADTYTNGTGGIALAWKFQGRLDIAPRARRCTMPAPASMPHTSGSSPSSTR